MRRALKLWGGAAVLLAIITVSAAAQANEADIRTRLVGKPLYLRSQASSDKLEFDEQGRLIQPSPLTSFTLAGVDVTKVKLSATELVLKANRIGLEFQKDVPKRVSLDGGSLTIRIMRPTDGDYTKALDAIFTDSFAGFDARYPSYWAKFALNHLLGAPDSKTEATTKVSSLPDKNFTAPVLLKLVDPAFSLSAHKLGYSGVVLVNMVVTPDGTPAQVNIVHAAGLGLDEAAVRAAANYKFKPATRDGQPVAVELNVEVNFQVF